MTILALQRRIQEAGRIRIGQQVATQNGGTRPAKLDTFRLTSADKARIVQAAELFGGTPREWQAPSGPQFEVVTEAKSIDVIVPPSEMAFSQHMELWAAGGCQRRCDGVTESISDGPCLCDAEDPECKPHSRLSVMIRELSGLGVWRIDTQGWYAAQELEGAVQVIAAAAGAGTLLPARLRLEQRQVKRKDPKTGKPQTRNFPVPVLDIDITPAQLLGGGANHAIGGPSGGLAALPQAQPEPERPALMTPVPPSVPERPTVPVAEQATQVRGSSRKSAQAPLPSTGVRPRTAAEVAGQTNGAPAAPVEEGPEDLEGLTVAQLKIRCKKAGVQVSGKKEELIERLMDADPELKHGPVDDVLPRADEEAPPPPEEPAAPAAGMSDDPGTISDKQVQRLAILCRELGVRDGKDDTLYRAALRATYGVDSSKDLSEKQASGLIRVLSDGRTPLGGDHEPPEKVAAAWLQKGDDWLAERERLGLRGRMYRGLQTIGADHEAYPELYERMTGLVEDYQDEASWDTADQGKVEELVVEVEAAAAEVDR